MESQPNFHTNSKNLKKASFIKRCQEICAEIPIKKGCYLQKYVKKKFYTSYFIENSLYNGREKRLLRKIFSPFFQRARGYFSVKQVPKDVLYAIFKHYQIFCS